MANDVYIAFCKSFNGFMKVCSFEYLDGQWLGPIVDHMCALLVQYAEAADAESLAELFHQSGAAKSPNSNQPAPTDSENNKNTKNAKTLLTDLFRVLQ